MNLSKHMLLWAFVLAVAPLARAQTASSAPATSVSGLTVTAPATPSFHERFVQSLNFVTARGAVAHLGQLARWADPPCPVALGLSPAANAYVSDRVKVLAAAIG